MTLLDAGLGLTRGGLLAAALLAGGCAGAGASSPGGQNVGSQPIQATLRTPIATARGLDSFFDDLQALESGRKARLHILQLGDSHTAGDVFSGYLRQRLQLRFGDSGRGVMPPGLAFPGLSQRQVTVTESGRWQIHNSRTATDSLPYGLSGFILSSAAAGDRISVSPNDGGVIDTAGVDFVQHPGGGAIAAIFDDRPGQIIQTAGPDGQVRHVSLTAPAGTRSFGLVAERPGVDIADWSIEKSHPGVLLESFGVISATVNIMQHWDPETVRQKLALLAPSLIILSYGTNEGFGPDFDPVAYATNLTGIVRELKRDSPGASILVIGPPDARRGDNHCVKRKGGKRECGWATPRALGQVRDTQRKVAAAEGLAFWDWSSVMERGIEPWVHADPPLARLDRVHFTTAGYEKAAAALYDVLMEKYAAFQRDRATHHAKIIR